MNNLFKSKHKTKEEGAYADPIVIDGNPLENLDFVGDADRNFVMIMKDGKAYKNTIQ